MQHSKVPSFQEFYHINESVADTVLIKWNELKELLKKDYEGKPINTKKMYSLRDEITFVLKRLKDINEDIAKELVQVIIKDPLSKWAFSQKKGMQTIRFLTVWLLHLIAIFGIMAFHSIKDKRRQEDGTAEIAKQHTSKYKETPTPVNTGMGAERPTSTGF
jgi:hypothetical protein